MVSRAADTVQRLTYDPTDGIIIGTDEIKQINLSPDCLNPIGIAIAPTRRRAYVNCWVNRRMGVIDLDAQVLTEAPQSAALPLPDSAAEQVRLGERFYFTGRGRWSANGDGFSSCGSCHPDGLSDGITWSFAAGPRQTTSMDGSFSHGAGPQQQRQFNWTGIFDEIHDFERNTRDVSGGLGAITVSPTDMCGNLSFEERGAAAGRRPRPAGQGGAGHHARRCARTIGTRSTRSPRPSGRRSHGAGSTPLRWRAAPRSSPAPAPATPVMPDPVSPLRTASGRRR